MLNIPLCITFFGDQKYPDSAVTALSATGEGAAQEYQPREFVFSKEKNPYTKVPIVSIFFFDVVGLLGSFPHSFRFNWIIKLTLSQVAVLTFTKQSARKFLFVFLGNHCKMPPESIQLLKEVSQTNLCTKLKFARIHEF